MGETLQRNDVHIHGRRLVVDVEVEEVTGVPKPRVVHEQIDWRCAGEQSLFHRLQLFTIGEIGNQHLYLDIVLDSNAGRQFFQPSFVSRNDDEIRPRCAKPLGKCQPDA